MKKVFLALAVMLAVTVVSCNKKADTVNDQITDSVTVVDSTQTDSTQVDTASVDTTQAK